VLQEDEEGDIDTSTDMLSSFYISDIAMIRDKVQNTDRIVQYIEALKTLVANYFDFHC